MKPHIEKLRGSSGWVCQDCVFFGLFRTGFGFSPKSAYDSWRVSCGK